MFRSVIVLFLCLFVQSAHASVFIGLGGGSRFVKNDDNNFKVKFTPLIYGGYRDLPWAYALEGLYFKEDSNAGASFHMKNTHYEAAVYILRFFNYEEGRAINPYAVAGLGVHQDRVKSNFMGTEDKDKSKINSAVKLGIGAWSQLGDMAFINLEAKGMYSQDFTPDIIFELSSRVGFEF